MRMQHCTNGDVYAIRHFVDLVTSPCTLAGCEQEAKEFSLRHNIYYSVVYEKNPLCNLRSTSKIHNGYIVHSSIQALVGLLAGRPRGTANLARPCVVQPEIDLLQYQSYTMLSHVRPHYTQPFRELLQRDGVFDVFEQLVAFFRHLHICATLQGLVYDSSNQKQNGARI